MQQQPRLSEVQEDGQREVLGKPPVLSGLEKLEKMLASKKIRKICANITGATKSIFNRTSKELHLEHAQRAPCASANASTATLFQDREGPINTDSISRDYNSIQLGSYQRRGAHHQNDNQQQQMQQVVNEGISAKILTSSEFERLSKNCFHQITGTVDVALREHWNSSLHNRIISDLKQRRSRGTNDARTCNPQLLMVGPKPRSDCMRPTIVFFTPDPFVEYFQGILAGMEFIDKNSFETKVLPPSETVLWASLGPVLDNMLSPASLQSANSIVEFATRDGILPVSKDQHITRGILCRFPQQEESYCYFTVGGFITVDGNLYGLTTAHQLYAPKSTGDSTRGLEMLSMLGLNFNDDIKVYEKSELNVYSPLGRIAASNWGYFNMTSTESPPSATDWALVKVDQKLAETEEIIELETTLKIDANDFNDNLDTSGPEGFKTVYVRSGRSQPQTGLLDLTVATLMLGDAFFNVHCIHLQHPLVDGDSGSWVLLNGKLCGHVICRADGAPKAFMLPIQNTVKDIKNNLETISAIKEAAIPGLTQIDHSGTTGDFDHIIHRASTDLPKSQNLSFQGDISSSESLSLYLRPETSSEVEFKASPVPRPFQERQSSTAVPGMPDKERIAEEDNPWNPKNVLSLDGGGIRGYYSLLCLRYLMERVKELEEDFTDGNGIQRRAPSSFHPLNESTGIFLPCHYFDYICGTSTGGLIAIMLSRLRMSVDDCIKAYLQLGGRVFGSPRLVHSLRLPFISDRTKFDARVLEEAIDEIVNEYSPPKEEKRFKSQSGFCQTFVCAYKQQGAASQLYIFRSYNQYTTPDATVRPLNPGGASLHHIWEVARATSAATFHFPPLVVYPGDRGRRQPTFTIPGRNPRASAVKPEATFLDGGLGHANNPSTEIYRELMRLGPTGSNAVFGTFISVGTGRKLADPFEKGFIKKIRAAFDAAGNTEVAHEEMQMHSRQANFSYTRLNEPDCLKDLNFDEWKGKGGCKTTKKMEDAFYRWVNQPEQQRNFYKCAWELVRRRRLRSASRFSSDWERYAVGTYFVCDKRCSASEGQKWSRRDQFISHLKAEHHMEAELSIDDEAARNEIIDRYISSRWEYPSQED